MKYLEWMDKVRDAVLIYDQESNQYFIQGTWRYHLYVDGISISNVIDYDELTWDIVKDTLEKDVLYLNRMPNDDTLIETIINKIIQARKNNDNNSNE